MGVFLVMDVISPGEVRLWEAIVTLLFFPILVLLAYAADKNFFGLFGKKRTQADIDDIEMGNVHLLDEGALKQTHPDIVEYIKEVTSNQNITEDEKATLIAL